MPREMITIQVGQCGNQIALRFWELALSEHAKYNKSNTYDDSLSSFFINTSKKKSLKLGSQIQNLKARAIVIDMEEGVINQILKSELGQLFDEKHFLHDVSGAGNNWAHGHYQYGNKYKQSIYEKVRAAAQKCDSLQAFFMMHSLGGGTGSGLGTFTLGLLQQYFPQIFRFTASVFPSQNDDVITSPYNSFLSLNQLIKHADCVFPIDNQALIKIVNQIQKPSMAKMVKNNVAFKGDNVNNAIQKNSKVINNEQGTKQKPYDKMNNIIAHLLSNLTCSMRFQGILNVDFNQITMNLVPYPDLHFLVSALSPLYSLKDSNMQPRRFDQMFDQIYDPSNQLLQSRPLQHTYLSLGLILRGKVSFSDVNHNIKKLRDKKNLKMIYWNNDGFKYGICNSPPLHQPYSLLCLANNTCISDKFKKMLDNYNKLFKRQLYMHHYTKYMCKDEFEVARQNVLNLINKYQSLEHKQIKKIKRLKPLFV